MPAVHILHVEDDPNDAFLVHRALLRAAQNWQIICVGDGDEALQYLGGAGQYADREHFPIPNLMLLDLKLRSMHGLDLLAWVRAHPQFRRLPIIVLSGSASETDQACALELGASSYFLKTPLYRGLAESIAKVLGARQLPALRCLGDPRASAGVIPSLAQENYDPGGPGL